jgi:2-hydroxychromene-2-carboxylate isomerase
VFDVIYGKGMQPDTPEGVQAIADALDISDPEIAMGDVSIKNTLRTNTESAIADGVFGVPTFLVGGQTFWGDDATDMMLNYLDDPSLFDTAEMKRVSNMPMGLTRTK